jgi:hypothetical protein
VPGLVAGVILVASFDVGVGFHGVIVTRPIWIFELLWVLRLFMRLFVYSTVIGIVLGCWVFVVDEIMIDETQCCVCNFYFCACHRL